jgi:hypothetical protein
MFVYIVMDLFVLMYIYMHMDMNLNMQNEHALEQVREHVH